MVLVLTPDQRADLEDAAAHARQTRSWKRYQALRLLADGQTIAQVSTAMACGQSTVYRWVAIWRAEGVERLAEGLHSGRTRRLDPAADARLQALLGSDPQTHGHHTTGWTVPLLLTALAAEGWVVHEHTLRRTLKRLGYRWKRPQYVLGRPDPAYAETRGPRGYDGAKKLSGRKRHLLVDTGGLERVMHFGRSRCNSRGMRGDFGLVEQSSRSHGAKRRRAATLP